MFFDHYPYTNFHNVNLDWVLQAVKSWGAMVEANNQGFIDLKAANASFKEYVTHYLQNLDVSDEINDKLDRMLADGVLAPYMAPYIQTDVSAWLSQHITPTTPAVDNSLTVSGAAADAKVTGDKLKARFGISFSDAEVITATADAPKDFNDYRTAGTFRVANVSNASHISNMPLRLAGVLVVVTRATGSCTQIYIPSQISPAFFIRSFISNEWSSWVNLNTRIDSTLTVSGAAADALATGENIANRFGLNYNDFTTISASAEDPKDLNNYHDSGNYKVLNVAAANNIANIPVQIGGLLIVIARTATSTLQIFIPAQPKASWFIRSYHSNTWYDWVNLSTPIDDTLSIAGAAADSAAVGEALASLTGSQWRGKSWYAYGTSITNISNEGKYATYLATMSGMILHNKGISGGGIGDLGGFSHGQVYDAICNTTDGKLNADIITLETGANDCNADVPLGTIYDTGRTTLAGCLNDCLRYLQENTNAQIVVTNSPATKTLPTASTQYYEWAEMVRRICDINRVHYINANCNLGAAKLNASSGGLYVVDNIHQTELGGYIYAQNLWYQIRNIPLFYTAIPTE